MTLTRRGRWVAGAAVALTVSIGAGLGISTPLPNVLPATTDAVLYEDERGWDCRTMGNGACGTRVDMSQCGPIGDPDGCPRWTPEP